MDSIVRKGSKGGAEWFEREESSMQSKLGKHTAETESNANAPRRPSHTSHR